MLGTGYANTPGASGYTMGQALTNSTLKQDNETYAGTAGVSAANRAQGFLPAFRDNATGQVYLSRFADGGIAPVHLLDGLPSEVVIKRTPIGTVKAVKASVIAGFVRAARFYTRGELAEIA